MRSRRPSAQPETVPDNAHTEQIQRLESAQSKTAPAAGQRKLPEAAGARPKRLRRNTTAVGACHDPRLPHAAAEANLETHAAMPNLPPPMKKPPAEEMKQAAAGVHEKQEAAASHE